MLMFLIFVTMLRKIHLWGKLVIWRIFQFFQLLRLRDIKEIHGLLHTLYVCLIPLLNFPNADRVSNLLSAWRILLLPVRSAKLVYYNLAKHLKSGAKENFVVLLNFHQLLIHLVARLLLTWYTMTASDLFLSVCLHFKSS